MKKAFITGVTGQDGSYLTEFLLGKGYEVHGMMRRASSFNTWRIHHLPVHLRNPNSNLHLHYGDLTDASSLSRLLRTINPDEIYHLGAQSHVQVSFEVPEYTADVTALGTLRLLEAIRETNPNIRFYQASSSEMIGLSSQSFQNEHTSFYPRSPYAVSKVFAYWITKNYREAHGLFAVNGILFNHESPRRGENFVSRKITMTAARIMAGLDKKIYLGNLDAMRDWGYAPEYCEAMWMMLQHHEPDDFVIATGESHSVREFLEETFTLLGRDWRDFVEIDPRYLRPSETPFLHGDYSKAHAKLGWEPKVTFKELVRIMLESDLQKYDLTLGDFK